MWGVGEGSAGAEELLVEEARATAGLESLDPHEPLLVRLLGFEAADAERSHSWRGVQVLNRGCDVAGLPDGGTLDVAFLACPSKPRPRGEGGFLVGEDRVVLCGGGEENYETRG